MRLREINESILTSGLGKKGLARKAGQIFLHVLKTIKTEIKELLIAYLVKTPGPFVKLAGAATDCLVEQTEESILRLGYCILDVAKMPVALIGLGYASAILPAFGIGATGMLASKMFGWLAYALYRVACSNPKYQGIIKAAFPREFLPKELKTQLDTERDNKIRAITNRKRDTNQQRPALEELPSK